MKKVLLAVAFMLVAQFGMAQTQDAFKTDVLKLIDISGANAAYDSAVNQIVKNAPADKQAALKKDILESLKQLTPKIADIYMTEFTHDDIKAMIKYYESPVGKKAASKAGVISEKSQAAAMEWAQGLQEIMMKYMQE
jgi:hypothetical protein